MTGYRITLIPTGEVFVSGNGPKEKNGMTRAIGVYQIRCLKTNEVYLGGARNIANRMSQHRALLRSGKHASKKLLHAWNVYGETAFVYEVLELCPLCQLREREGFWLEATGNQLLNTHPKIRGYKREFRPEVRAKLSKKAKKAHREGKLGQATWSKDSHRRCSTHWRSAS